MADHKLPKLIAIVGPTASGKTALALELARNLHGDARGEIICADSRTAYRGMDIGTAQPTPAQQSLIPHHLLDITTPDQPLSLAEFQALAFRAIQDITSRDHIPLLVGGTAQYIYAIIDNWQIPEVPPNTSLRHSLEQKTSEGLWRELMTLDPTAAEFVDPKNKRRIIRALEVIKATGQPFSNQRKRGSRLFETLMLGLNPDEVTLRKTIAQRTDEMLAHGLINEVRGLLAQYDKNLPAFSGIHYREVIDYLENKMSDARMIEQINTHDWQLTRRQLTWFKKDPRIHWISSLEEAQKLLNTFL